MTAASSTSVKARCFHEGRRATKREKRWRGSRIRTPRAGESVCARSNAERHFAPRIVIVIHPRRPFALQPGQVERGRRGARDVAHRVRPRKVEAQIDAAYRRWRRFAEIQFPLGSAVGFYALVT